MSKSYDPWTSLDITDVKYGTERKLQINSGVKRTIRASDGIPKGDYTEAFQPYYGPSWESETTPVEAASQAKAYERDRG